MGRKKYICVVSGEVIPKERVEALKMLGTPEHQWTTVKHSLTKPRQGIFLGESGTSKLLMVDKVYNDSVRSVFKAATADDTHSDYNATDIDYYTGEEEHASADADAQGIS